MKKLPLFVFILFTCPVFNLLAQLPYTNPALSHEARAQDLLGRLTLEEKVALMQDQSPAVPRLGVPEFGWWNEALHGVARSGYATVFPQAIGMAASFDEDAVFRTFTAVSDEARAKATHSKQVEGRRGKYRNLTFWTPNTITSSLGTGPWRRFRPDHHLTRRSRGQRSAGPDDSHIQGLRQTLRQARPRMEPGTASMPKTFAPKTYGKPIRLLSKLLAVSCRQTNNVRIQPLQEGDLCCASNSLLVDILREGCKPLRHVKGGQGRGITTISTIGAK